MKDKIIMRNVDFIKLPKDIRKSELVSSTNHYRECFTKEENKKHTYKDDYKYICKMFYFMDKDLKWVLIKDNYGDLFSFRSDRYAEIEAYDGIN